MADTSALLAGTRLADIRKDALAGSDTDFLLKLIDRLVAERPDARCQVIAELQRMETEFTRAGKVVSARVIAGAVRRLRDAHVTGGAA